MAFAEVVWCAHCDNTADVSCTIEHDCYEAVVVPKRGVKQIGWWSEKNQRFNRIWQLKPDAPCYVGDAQPVYVHIDGGHDAP